jgi:hypothetical protein
MQIYKLFETERTVLSFFFGFTFKKYLP